MWIADVRAHVDPHQDVDFEPYYFTVFSKLEAAAETMEGLEEFIAKPQKYPALRIVGTYREVPLVSLQTEREVQDMVIRPAVDLWRTSI